MSYRPNGGHGVACCGGNVHRIFPNYTIRMWMNDAKGGLVATLYGPSKLKATVGPGRHTVEIYEETNYPFEEEIHFTIDCGDPVSFPLSFRVPGWCTDPHFFLNEKPIPLPPIQSGFARLRRNFHPGDKITLVLPMKTALSRWPDNGSQLNTGLWFIPCRSKRIGHVWLCPSIRLQNFLIGMQRRLPRGITGSPSTSPNWIPKYW